MLKMNKSSISCPLSIITKSTLLQNNTDFLSEYSEEIYKTLYEKERSIKLPNNYMFLVQKETKPKHRDKLIDWISRVCVNMRSSTEIFFLAVAIIDHSLAVLQVIKSKVLLIGLAALVIAYKVESQETPSIIGNLQYLSDNLYDKSEILRVERLILSALDYNLNIPTPIPFVYLFTQVTSLDKETTFLVDYITELSCLFYSSITFLPSQIAASSCYLAVDITKCPQANFSELSMCQGYDKLSLLDCITALKVILAKSFLTTSNIIYMKYTKRKFLSVAKIVIDNN